jgi:hypothetical protein
MAQKQRILMHFCAFLARIKAVLDALTRPMPQPGSEDATTGYSQYDFSLDAASRQVSESADGHEILRDFIHATLGFPALIRKTGIHVKTLHQMFGPRGNPTAAN